MLKASAPRQLWWNGLPCCSRGLLVMAILQATLACCLILTASAWGCNIHHSPHDLRWQRCSLEQWQVMASALMSQLSLAVIVTQAMYTENDCQLSASQVVTCLSGLLWILFLVVVGKSLALAARVACVLAVIVFAAVDITLLRLSHHQLGWRQNSWQCCDLRTKHAAEQQQLGWALNAFRTCRRCCMYIVLLSMINGVLLALRSQFSTNYEAAAAQPTDGAEPLQDQVVPVNSFSRAGWGMSKHSAETGVAVATGLTTLPLFWLGLASLAVRRNSKALEALSTATIAVAVLCPALQLCFVFSTVYVTTRELVVELLLVAAPMAIWMSLLISTWWCCRRVMHLMRQPWAAELAACSMPPGNELHLEDPRGAIPGQIPLDFLQPLLPLMRGAWLIKQSLQPTRPVQLKQCLIHSKRDISSLASSSAQLHDTGRNPVSTGTSVVKIGSAGSSSSSRSLLAAATCRACRYNYWHTVVAAVCGKQHERFFQLSLDGTVLRWGWKKYVLLYFVDALSFEAEHLRIVLHCVLEPDLCLTCPDADLWHQWVEGLQAALQMASGEPSSSPTTPADTKKPRKRTGIFALQSQQTASMLVHSSVSAGSVARRKDESPSCGQHHLQERLVKLPTPTAQPAPMAPTAEPNASRNAPQLASTLHHQLVRTALYNQQTCQLAPNLRSIETEPGPHSVLVMGGTTGVSRQLRKTHSVCAGWPTSRCA